MSTLRCISISLALIAAIAAAVVAAGQSAPARDLLGLPFTDTTPIPGSALDIATANARLAVGVLLAAAAAARVGRTMRAALDVGLGVIAAVNIALLGLALGAYGGRALAALGPHLLPELVALSACANTYLAGRRRAPRIAELARTAASAVTLLLVAAMLETYVHLGTR